MAEEPFEEEILKTAVERREVLSLLSEPHHRQEIQERLDISKTTCHRIVRTLDDNGLLDRTDRGYELTQKGVLLEAYVDEYYRGVRATFELEPLITSFDDASVEFQIDPFVDARITRPEPNDPTVTLSREFEIFQNSDYFTVVDSNQYVPDLYLEQVIEIGIKQGMEAEHIAPISVIEKRLSAFPEVHKEHTDLAATMKYRVCPSPGPPFGLTLYDNEHVVLRAYDHETGSPVLLVDTEEPDAVVWAEDVIDHYRAKAESPAAVDDLPDWTPDGDLSF